MEAEEKIAFISMEENITVKVEPSLIVKEEIEDPVKKEELIVVDPTEIKTEVDDDDDAEAKILSNRKDIPSEEVKFLHTGNELLTEYYQKTLPFCGPCNQTFGSIEENQNHWPERHNEPVQFFCRFGDCSWVGGGSVSFTKTHILQHLVDSGHLVKCDCCGEPQLKELFGKHILICVKHKQGQNEIDEIIKDLLNAENYDKYYKWKKLPPVETYVRKILSYCHKCGVSLGTYKDVVTHWETDHGEEEIRFGCRFSICSFVCQKQDELKDHIDQHLLLAGRHTKCPICAKIFNKCKLTPHIKQKGRRRRRINGDTLACEWAPPFNNPIPNVHSDAEKKAECHLCEKKFKQERYVRKHVKDVHAKEERICEFCPKAFPQLRQLKTHIRTQHSKGEKSKTEDESEETKTGSNKEDEAAKALLALSQAVVPYNPPTEKDNSEEEMEVDEPSPVPVLPGPSSDNSNIVEETAEVESTAKSKEGETLLYSCKECDKSYGRRDVLRKHIRTKHIETQPSQTVFNCTECGKVYGRQDCLRKHYRRKHLQPNKKYEIFCCTQCKNTYTSRDKLTRHQIQHTASDGKPFQCSECEERFSRKDAMSRHIKRQHDPLAPS